MAQADLYRMNSIRRLLPHFTQVFVEHNYLTKKILFQYILRSPARDYPARTKQCPLNMTAHNKPHLVQIMETSKSVQACQLFWRVIFAECKKLFTVTQAATHSILVFFNEKLFMQPTIVCTFFYWRTLSESEVLLLISASRYPIILAQCRKN